MFSDGMKRKMKKPAKLKPLIKKSDKINKKRAVTIVEGVLVELESNTMGD